jgi:hypothetical protein
MDWGICATLLAMRRIGCDYKDVHVQLTTSRWALKNVRA